MYHFLYFPQPYILPVVNISTTECFLTQQTLVQLPRIGEGPGIDSQGSVEQSTVVTGFKERKSFICAELIFAKYIIINHINNLFEKNIPFLKDSKDKLF